MLLTRSPLANAEHWPQNIAEQTQNIAEIFLFRVGLRPVRVCPRSVPRTDTFDLHALSTPPAFILSQDQTLNKNTQNHSRNLEYCLHGLPITTYKGRCEDKHHKGLDLVNDKKSRKMTSSSRDHVAKIAFLLYVATITQSSYRHLLFTFQGPFIKHSGLSP